VDPITLIVIFISTWVVCGVNAAKKLDNYYHRQGDSFYKLNAKGISEANFCVFFLGPVGLLGVFLLLKAD